MNIGELKSQKTLFNSQLQLNSDLLASSKGSKSSFEDILKKRTSYRSAETDDTGPKYKGMTNVTMNSNYKNGLNQKIKSEYNNYRVDRGNSLKKQINEDIAHNKFVNSNDQVKNIRNEVKSLDQIEDFDEKLKELDRILNEKLGLETKASNEVEELLKEVASMLGIDLNTLIEMLPVEVQESELQNLEVSELESLIELISSNPEVKELLNNEIENVIGNNETTSFVEILENVMTELPEGEIKTEIEAVVNNLIDTSEKTLETNVLETAVEEVVSTAVDLSQKNTLSDNSTQDVVESNVSEEDVKVTETNNNDNSNNEQGNELARGNQSKVETTGKVEVANTEFDSEMEEQISVAKDQNTLITSAKNVSQPRAVVAKSIINQIVQGTKMSVKLSDEGSEILIKLNPKNLGNVALKMSFEKGVLLAQINVENQTVKGLIESNLDDLKNSLKDEGYMIGDLDVSVNKENSGQQEQSFSQNSSNNSDFESFEDIEEKVIQEKQRLVNNKEVDYLA